LPKWCCGSPQGDPHADRRARAGPGRLRPGAGSALAGSVVLLEAIARDALGDPGAPERALERALDLAEPDSMLLAFLLYPAPGLVERHARQRTAHASLLAEIRSLQAGKTPPALAARPQPPLELLSDSEIRVLRYLPTNL
jgi:LuxR family transcriptional regulator, maltose regulon positive regulatory protein